MKDDELLDIWEQVQRIMIALQDHIIPGVEMKSGVEDAVSWNSCAVIRCAARLTCGTRSARRTCSPFLRDGAGSTARRGVPARPVSPGFSQKTKRGVLLRKRRRTAPFF